MRIYALIPARSGSKGLPEKNILPIDGHPLMAYSIAFGLRLKIDAVIVSTDSPKYAGIAREYGALCPYLRGHTASSDTAMKENILHDLNEHLPKYGVSIPDIWIWLKPTCPFRDLDAARQGIFALNSRPELDSVRFVTEADARLHTINANGYLEPLSSHWDPKRSKMRRSEFPRTFHPFNLEIFRHEGWNQRGPLFMGSNILPIILPRITGLDIDGIDDFEIIKSLIESRPRSKVVQKYVHL